ncbi:MAG: hypothetical protein LBU95_04455 [Rikenellaceae bacterium]|jgi:hypothetical protein|nr:hypothetical protein [Rikenellaceae bacterium]
MEDIDKDELPDGFVPDDDEEQLLHAHVIQGDHKLFYLDTYLRDMFTQE